MALTCGGMTDSSWMESIWPSLSAAPRMRQSATASRSAFASVMNTESPGRMDSTDAVEVSPPSAPGALPPLPLHARLADSEMVPAARPAAREPKPMTRWIGDDGTATARRSVDGGLLGVTRGGAVDAVAEDARLSPSVASGAAFGLEAGAGVGLGPGALNGVAVGFSFSDDAVPGAVRARWAAAAATGAASRVFPPLMSKSAAARSGPREPRPSTPLSAAPVRATPRTVLARRAAALARSGILSIQSRERSRGRRKVVPIDESTWPFTEENYWPRAKVGFTVTTGPSPTLTKLKKHPMRTRVGTHGPSYARSLWHGVPSWSAACGDTV